MFLTLADTLSYTKTAEIFGVTQPTISRNIYKLEVSLGLQLFIRDTSKVILTPAGKSLYEASPRERLPPKPPGRKLWKY